MKVLSKRWLLASTTVAIAAVLGVVGWVQYARWNTQVLLFGFSQEVARHGWTLTAASNRVSPS